MKRTFLLTISVVVALCGAATDRFYIEDFTIAPGDTCTVNIMLDNEMAYTAFQSDLYLPNGLTAMNFALTDRKSTNHSFTATVFPDGGIRLLSYSLKLKTYNGNNGALVTFDVIASENFEGPVVISLRNSLFTTEAGIEVPFDNESCTVTLPATVIRGDVNGDGSVNMDDLSDLINYLLTGNSAGINMANAASCDSPNSTTVSMDDLSALINYLLTGLWQ